MRFCQFVASWNLVSESYSCKNDAIHKIVQSVSFVGHAQNYFLNPLRREEADISARTFPAIVRQPIELKSCSNPLKMQKVSWFRLQNSGIFQVVISLFFLDWPWILGFMVENLWPKVITNYIILKWIPRRLINLLFRFTGWGKLRISTSVKGFERCRYSMADFNHILKKVIRACIPTLLIVYKFVWFWLS